MKHIYPPILLASLLAYSTSANANLFVNLIPEIFNVASEIYTFTLHRGIITLDGRNIIVKQRYRAFDSTNNSEVIVNKGIYKNLSRYQSEIKFKLRSGEVLRVKIRYIDIRR